MNEITQHALRTTIELGLQESHRKFHQYPFRASDTGGCMRDTVLKHTIEAPPLPNQWSGWQQGHLAEELAWRLLRGMGFEITFPHGKQRGAHDAPDFICCFDPEEDRKIANGYYFTEDPADDPLIHARLNRSVACIHIDGELRVTESMPVDTLQVLQNLKDGPIDRRNDIGILSVKNPGAASFEFQRDRGARFDYVKQILVEYMGRKQRGQKPPYALLVMINGAVKLDVRDFVDAGSWAHPEPLLEKYQDVLHIQAFSALELESLSLQYADDIARYYKEKRAHLDAGTDPGIPSEIEGKEPGPTHWKCMEYCGMAHVCWNPEDIDRARYESEKRRTGMAFGAFNRKWAGHYLHESAKAAKSEKESVKAMGAEKPPKAPKAPKAPKPPTKPKGPLKPRVAKPQQGEL